MSKILADEALGAVQWSIDGAIVSWISILEVRIIEVLREEVSIDTDFPSIIREMQREEIDQNWCKLKMLLFFVRMW